MRIFYQGASAPRSVDQNKVAQQKSRMSKVQYDSFPFLTRPKMQAPLQRDTVCFTSRPDKVSQVSFKGLDSKVGNIDKAIYLNDEGQKSDKATLGGKGFGLADMTSMGLPVPPFFTISTQVCHLYKKENKLPDELMPKVLNHMRELEKTENKKFGDNNNPLLVSVRSGAPVSMPGMMDTVLNLGLNDKTVEGLAKQTEGNERFAYDSYRRFISMFSNIVLDIKGKDRRGNDIDLFAKKLDEYKEQKLEKIKKQLEIEGKEIPEDLKVEDTDLDVSELKNLVNDYKVIVKEQTGKDFPQDVNKQLELAIDAVFKSWDGKRAIDYRRQHNISDDLGTAVSVCGMVFGNLNDNSGTGVLFTCNPDTGETGLSGDYVTKAQGEDVVAGIRKTKPIKALATEMPEVYKELSQIAASLKERNNDEQDIEFTIENNKLYILQTRNAKRTAQAQIKTAMNFYNAGKIDKKEVIKRIEANRIREVLFDIFDPEEEKKATTIIKDGLGVSPGCGTGEIVFNSTEAKRRGEAGEKVILFRPETSPEDVAGMTASKGIVTTAGGEVSHAAVLAKQAGVPCVISSDLKVDIENETATTKNGKVFKKGDIVSINGTAGNIYEGKVKTIPPKIDGDFKTIIKWAKDIINGKVQIRANADNAKEAKLSMELGADGIGLTRTEHMFTDDRIDAIQEMIFADTEEEKEKAIKKLYDLQYGDFKEIFKAEGKNPVTARLLDPPLHEFLPKYDELLIEVNNLEHEIDKSKGSLSDTTKIEAELKEKSAILDKVKQLKEQNPMMGLRGCRLGLMRPEITEMQVGAIIKAACDAKKETGTEVHPEIMVPLVSTIEELRSTKKIVKAVAEAVMKEEGVQVDYKFGTMIETPRAALIADQLARECDFFSFGTNDLTQMTWGFSRDDTREIIGKYKDDKIVDSDPFNTLDTEGVGQLMKLTIDKARPVLEEEGRLDKFKFSICGEHGGESDSVKAALGYGLNCTSASPYRVPTSVMAAAQKELENKKTAA